MAGYADDVAFFISSDGKDQLTKDILQILVKLLGYEPICRRAVNKVWCGNSGGSKKHFAMY